ncbi:hypothetical protein JAAARDRAFT_30889 [Jaapia argillacea MUCL 33604]|uniref:ubiquitinyl hydrolase 1 n=1 Tax=Jaapia argillacea MUCL 33604 TaxID=933084 RepID=A0A067Q5P6_9AGAM|nr:hypothetical protein JAAARDRAFT_30889 [Jaapia argillacea MUCL 33604]
MPGVSVLPPPPPSPAFGRFPTSASKMQNGHPRTADTLTVAEIKERAKDQALHASRGASALSLIKGARSQIATGRGCESDGDLKGALSAFVKSAALMQSVMNSAELQAESRPGRQGVLSKEVSEFLQREGNDLPKRVQSLESRLKELESSTPRENGTGANPKTNGVDSSPQKSGRGIADRVRALQDAGLELPPPKRLSKDLSNTNTPLTPPMAPQAVRVNRISIPGSSPTIQSSSIAGTSHPSTRQSASNGPISPTTQQHVFVHPSSFGPPSPTSSTSSSPRINHLSLSEFTQTFPSIDELDEINGLKLPSVPTGGGGSSPDSTGKLSSLDIRPELALPSPSVASKAFPVLPTIDPGPRPSSTPIRPSHDIFAHSRPASPSPNARNSVPAVPRKPSNLSLNSGSPKPSRSPLIPSTPTAPIDLPQANTIGPETLHEYMYQSGVKVLLIDLRTREAFGKEHIRADAVICLEPSILNRDHVTGDSIEDSFTVAPRDEWVLFINRDKFDLVAFYDDSSDSHGPLNSPFNTLFHAIYETAFRKVLKKMPVLLVGGLHAWKEKFPDEVSVGSKSSTPDGRSPNGLPPLAIAASHSFPIPEPQLISRPRATTDHSKGPSPERRGPPPLPEIPAVSVSRPRAGTDHQPVASSSKPSPQVSVSPPSETNGVLPRKPALPRPPSTPHIPSYNRGLYESAPVQQIPQPMTTSSSIQYPQFPRPSPPTMPPSSYTPPGHFGVVSPPPQASINPSPLSRRRSDYVDQSQEALSGLNGRASIDYPNLSSQHLIRPPPAAASPSLERQDNRPRGLPPVPPPHTAPQAGPRPPTIQSDYPVPYWSDVQIATLGLKNLGNTCYMNATIQCLNATVPFARFFTDGRWKSAVNMVNPLGTKGNLTNAFASILHEMWHGELPYLSPLLFRRSICNHASQFGGSDQHDSQEFLSFLLDGLHEDLNRILQKPTTEPTPEREAELERLPQQIASEQEWKIYRMRNDSIVVDFFQGQFRNRMECMTCHKTSTTYNTFMYLTLPVPTGRNSKVTLNQCLDTFVQEEVMDHSDAWKCPNCKALRKATKRLSISRLPPILLIHLKRFSFKGPFTDKIETVVDFPQKGLDLTNYMPPPLPPGVDKSQLNDGHPMSPDDPRAQLPPYRYDLYGVTNHFGSLSSGHYTAFIASRGGWMYCDDSRVTPTDAKEVVGKPAYVLYYKRVKA